MSRVGSLSLSATKIFGSVRSSRHVYCHRRCHFPVMFFPKTTSVAQPVMNPASYLSSSNTSVAKRTFGSVSDASILTLRPASGIAQIILNRPETRNSLSLDMLEALKHALTELAAASDGTQCTAKKQDEVRVLVLSARGPVFCSGHNLKEIESKMDDRLYLERLFRLCAEVMIAVENFPVPVITQVHGIATAAGCQLVASSDLVLAATKTVQFATPGVNIGLFCSTPAVPLVRKVQRSLANYMLFTGNAISAERAREGGLVTDILESNMVQKADSPERHLKSERDTEFGLLKHQVPVPFDFSSGEMHPKTLDMAVSIACKSSRALQIGKVLLQRITDDGSSDFDDSSKRMYDIAEETMCRNMLEADAREGISAFLQKRKPRWQWQHS